MLTGTSGGCRPHLGHPVTPRSVLWHGKGTPPWHLAMTHWSLTSGLFAHLWYCLLSAGRSTSWPSSQSGAWASPAEGWFFSKAFIVNCRVLTTRMATRSLLKSKCRQSSTASKTQPAQKPAASLLLCCLYSIIKKLLPLLNKHNI